MNTSCDWGGETRPRAGRTSGSEGAVAICPCCFGELRRALSRQGLKAREAETLRGAAARG